MTDRIDHAAEAVKQVENMVEFGNTTESGSYEEAAYIQQRIGNGLALAQVHATLAVAEQLRVANLVTVASFSYSESEAVEMARRARRALTAVYGDKLMENLGA